MFQCLDVVFDLIFHRKNMFFDSFAAFLLGSYYYLCFCFLNIGPKIYLCIFYSRCIRLSFAKLHRFRLFRIFVCLSVCLIFRWVQARLTWKLRVFCWQCILDLKWLSREFCTIYLNRNAWMDLIVGLQASGQNISSCSQATWTSSVLCCLYTYYNF